MSQTNEKGATSAWTVALVLLGMVALLIAANM